MSADRTWERMDAAAEAMATVAGQLEGVAALVGQRARQVGPENEMALELTLAEAHGFAQVLSLIATQLRRAETDLRGQALGETLDRAV
jgi:hypothetical protein